MTGVPIKMENSDTDICTWIEHLVKIKAEIG